MSDLSDALKQLRQNANMTQRQLANAMGIHFTYISKIENDAIDMLPSGDLLRRMAVCLGADEGVLLMAANKLDLKAIQSIASASPVIAHFLRQLIAGKISDDQIARLLQMTGDAP
jgi:transcriptional regulator with XRE-family HTH domain